MVAAAAAVSAAVVLRFSVGEVHKIDAVNFVWTGLSLSLIHI